MASTGNDPITGAPTFGDTDAPDPAVNPTQVAEYAGQVGTRLIGDTAARLAYKYARHGLAWYDTALNLEFLHDGSGWKRLNGASDVIAPSTGWEIRSQQFYKVGGLVFWNAQVTRSGGSLSISATGYILAGGATVGTVGTDWRPPTPQPVSASASDAADRPVAGGAIRADGTIRIVYVNGTGDVTTGQWLGIGGVYPLA